MTNKTLPMVPASERDQISRLLLQWLNQYSDKPVAAINYEYLDEGVPSMALSGIQGAYKTRQYIVGGYEAEYPFKLIYRTQPGNSNNNRLKAAELLDTFGDWITANYTEIDLGENIRAIKIELDARSSFFGRYENGDEDYQILLTMTYEVIKNGW